MLALYCSWLFILVLSGGLGGFVLRLVKPPSSIDVLTKVVLSLWLGLFSLGVLLLAVALFVPLTLGVGVVLLLVALILLYRLAWWKELISRLEPSVVALVILVTFGLSPACLQPVTNTDAVSYQYDIIAWLSHLGTVPGLALVHSRFGFISSWFTIPALFNHGVLEARMTGVCNSFALVLVASHTVLILRRVCLGRGKSHEVYIMAAYVLGLFFPVFLNSASLPVHDFAIVILVLLSAWMLILTQEYPGGSRWSLLPVIFAIFAIAVKLSAIPLLITVGLIGLHRSGYSLKYVLTVMACGLLLFGPWLISQIVISGWPLFPLGFGLPLPWALGLEAVAHEIAEIKEYSPFGSCSKVGFWGMVKSWLQQEHTDVFALLYMLVSFFVVSMWKFVSPLKKEIPKSLLILGLAGILFWLKTTAHPRFGWGYLAVLPAGLVVVIWRLYFAGLAYNKKVAWIISLVVVLALFVPCSVHYNTETEREYDEAAERGEFPAGQLLPILRPPLIPQIQYPDGGEYAEFYNHAVIEKDLMPLKARPLYYKIDLQYKLGLRDPKRGIRGGFVPLSPGELAPARLGDVVE